jgi:predicted nucleic acid-binding protein
MILLDTNVVSEAWRARPIAAVIDWMDAQPATSLYICTPVLAELRYGVERLPASRRRDRIRALVDRLEADTYRGRILTVDAAAAAEFGRVAAKKERAGRRMEPMDALIAAIALTQQATFATRDVGDFSDLGLNIVNPFDLDNSTG